MHSTLADINTHINDLCPIHKLPQELLLYIFQTTTASSRDPARRLLLEHEDDMCLDIQSEDDFTARVDIAPLITLTGVCRRWRDILLCSPSMWAHLNAHSSEEFRVFKERAQNFPLSLMMDADCLEIPPRPKSIPNGDDRLHSQ